mmetsp:Transcript_5924/g.9238  ORF Transcript_5924/g.9238 Transcript_5924/m.9238 type:complete len:590 (+) Transcript_5924:365-2134(+)|eukprot:CAMPEP_0203758984 /NCGR_PEP_ID=MMETSP0098-20131031/11894_1 /ASSEMBLY_ACC=CAM_ASM_000208 /TAXON_ID=96639 /ORGANISM=" , Strain NY0313808BC1" /LENGTH=589 /DNA_ID=CAMNT_0050651689 /DNA_START=3543 /DNA_END=5312 /DNA_ORIENTATION=-
MAPTDCVDCPQGGLLNKSMNTDVPEEENALKGQALLRNQKYNKGLGFTHEERAELGLHGLLPASFEDVEKQVAREMNHLRRKPNNIEKYVFLMSVLDRNEQLFYRLLTQHMKECMPIVYTPTVGQACQEYGQIWSNPRGLYVGLNDLGNVETLVNNWPEDDVRVIVFTDGERILGLGDLGTNGMGIPVGKLQLYSACAGIAPHHCLPVCIDAGTNNTELRESDFYLGTKAERCRGPEFDSLVEEFMGACKSRWGESVILQFEDFGNLNAFRLLENSRQKFATFNDDIQGTASVTLAGVLSSLRVTSKLEGGAKTLRDHKFVFLGAGEAGTGIANLIAHAIQDQCEEDITLAQARENIWLVDSRGLVTQKRKLQGGLQHHKLDFAHDLTEDMVAHLKGTEFEVKDGKITSLEQAVRAVNATAIIGVSAIPQTFTKSICEFLTTVSPAPLIFALSNPTSQAECTAEQAYKWTNGKCIFASGSPFDPVTHNGKTYVPGQGNNAYIFPGLGLGLIAAKATTIPDDLLYVSAKTLAEQVSEEDLDNGSMYPPIEDIRKVSANIAAKVAARAHKLQIATEENKQDMLAYVYSLMV